MMQKLTKNNQMDYKLFLFTILLLKCWSISGQHLISSLNPSNLLGALKLVNNVQKIMPTEGLVETIAAYAPVNMPNKGDKQSTEALHLDSKEFKLNLPPDKVKYLITFAGLDSKNIEWKLYNFPLTVAQIKMILSSSQRQPGSRFSIMSMDAYIPKILASFDRMSDAHFAIFEKFIETKMDADELEEYIEKLNNVEEGMFILPVSIKHGAITCEPGSIVLLGLGKFSTRSNNKPSLIPTILVGNVLQNPVIVKPVEPIKESIVIIEEPKLKPVESPNEPMVIATEEISLEKPIIESQEDLKMLIATETNNQGSIESHHHPETITVYHGPPKVHVQHYQQPYPPPHQQRPHHYQQQPQVRPGHPQRPLPDSYQRTYQGNPQPRPIPRPRMQPRNVEEQIESLS